MNLHQTKHQQFLRSTLYRDFFNLILPLVNQTKISILCTKLKPDIDAYTRFLYDPFHRLETYFK